MNQGTFSVGEILADRFEVVRFLARGGMGEVYAAKDLELDEVVAVKIVRPNRADPDVLARFRREVQLARRVTHPSVCRVYDLFRHYETQTKIPHQALILISMELLEGETLASILRRRGPLDVADATPIVSQILAGLSTAHAEGIIHRDLKGSNVILAPSPRGERVVVTDFGLARLQDLSDDDPTLSDHGMMVGTPSYMAPEQVRGDTIGPQTDLYALGVLMFEMVTGRLPFPGESRKKVAAQRLWQEAPDPGSLVPDLDPTWRKAILRCLAMRPEDRFDSCGELAEFLDLERVSFSGPASSGIHRAPQRRRNRWVWGSVAALLVGFGLAAGPLDMLRWQSQSVLDVGSRMPQERTNAQAENTRTADTRTSVAVLFFDNLTGDPDLEWMRVGLADMMISTLSWNEDLRVLSMSRLYEVLRDRGLSASQPSVAVAGDVARHAEADRVVLGTISRLGSTVRIEVKLQDVDSGEVLASHMVDGRLEDELFTMVDDLSLGIRRHFEIGRSYGETTGGAQAKRPAVSTNSVDAYQAYVSGMREHLDSRESKAMEYFERAVELDPDFSMAWARMAVVADNMGHPGTLTFSERALAGAHRITPHERRYIEGFHHSLRPATQHRAIETYRQELAVDPTNDHVRHNLALAYADLERYDDAIQEHEVQSLWADDISARNLAYFYQLTGRYGDAERLLQIITDRNPGLHWTHTDRALGALLQGLLPEAEGFLEISARADPWDYLQITYTCLAKILRDDLEGALAFGSRPLDSQEIASVQAAAVCHLRSLEHLGQTAEALSLIDRLLTLPEHVSTYPSLILRAAQLHLDRGEPEIALGKARVALETDTLGWVGLRASYLAARAAQTQGDTDAAQSWIDRLDTAIAETSIPQLERRRHVFQAVLASQRGDTAEALDLLETAVASLPQHEHFEGRMPSGHARTLWALARANAEAGLEARAVEIWHRLATSTLERFMDPIPHVRSLHALGEYHRQAGDAAMARRYFRKYLEAWGDGDLDRPQVEAVKTFLDAPG